MARAIIPKVSKAALWPGPRVGTSVGDSGELSSQLPLVSAALLELGSEGIPPSNCIDAALRQPRGNCLAAGRCDVARFERTKRRSEGRRLVVAQATSVNQGCR